MRSPRQGLWTGLWELRLKEPAGALRVLFEGEESTPGALKVQLSGRRSAFPEDGLQFPHFGGAAFANVSCPQRLFVLSTANGADEGPEDGLRAVFRPLEALGVQVLFGKELDQTAPETAEALRTDVLVVPPSAFATQSGPLRLNGALRRLERGGKSGHSIPILLIADPDDPIPAVVAGRSLRDTAVWDIVRRDAPTEEILLRTERLVAQAQALAELERAKYQASHDDRTGLLRPGPFDDRLREHFSAAQRHRLEFALVLVDLDRFGEVNKAYDHTVGDELIARSGSVIRMTLRAEDVGARIGGDEFALILPYTHRVAAARVVSRLTAKFKALSGPAPSHFYRRDGSGERSSIAVSASLGFETFDGQDIESPEELRRRAERALNEAKSRGGNKGVYYRTLDPTLPPQSPHAENLPEAGPLAEGQRSATKERNGRATDPAQRPDGRGHPGRLPDEHRP